MSDYTVRLLRRHQKDGIILDTNILLLYFVGLLDPQLVPRFKRTITFTPEDFYTLRAMLKFAPKVVTTPNILTEVSNLLGQLPDHQKGLCFDLFAQGIALVEERYLLSTAMAELQEFRRFGITDAGLVHLAKEKHLIITDDFRLSQYIQSIGSNALNFNHIRTINWK